MISLFLLALLLQISNAAQQNSAIINNKLSTRNYETTTTTNPKTATHQKSKSNHNHRKLSKAQQNPFLSTTLSTKITSISDDLKMDSSRKILFSETLTRFLTKIFKDQQVYDVKIISVNLFDDHVITNNGVQQQQQQEEDDDDDDRYEQVNSYLVVNNDNEPTTTTTVSFSTVVSAEYTKKDQINSIANDNFRKMLIHVCDKFQSHLIQFMRDTGDPYFANVERVELGDFERMNHNHGGVEGGNDGGVGDDNKVFGMSDEAVNVASIVAIVIGSMAFLVLLFASMKYYREEKQLNEMKWTTSKEMESSIKSNASSRRNRPTQRALLSSHTHTSNVVVDDDYSFSPLGMISMNDAYKPDNDVPPPYSSYRDDDVAVAIQSNTTTVSSMMNNNNEEQITFSSIWPNESTSQSPPPSSTLFPAKVSPEAMAAAAPTTKPKELSYTQQLQKLPKQHVFAPPGKIGVAIDVYNGQPVVHKVRKNSPLENMLRPNDVIVAIDDEDASCLSAADVTSLMVKRMDRVRKITFVRRE